MTRVPSPSDSPWLRGIHRRDVLKLAGLLAVGGTIAPLIAACTVPSPSESPPAGSASGATPGPSAGLSSPALAGSITFLAEGGDPASEPALAKVYDDFEALHPGVKWDVRSVTGLGADLDRLARAVMESGEPVGLIALDGLFVRAWARDGLLADLGADPGLADVLGRVPERFRLSAVGSTSARAFPLALSRGVQTTGLYYNKALLDQAGVGVPETIADLKAMVEPLAALGAAPLVHCSGDVSFNPLLVMWLLPMIAGRSGDPLAFVERTIRGEVAYDSAEWIEAFKIIADLRASGVLLSGSGATDYATMQLLLLQGKAAMTYNGTWLMSQLQAATPSVAFDLHASPLPRVDPTSTARSTLSWAGFALPAKASASADSVRAFLEYASRPDIDAAVVEGIQSYSPFAASNAAIHDSLAREFLPMFEDAITSLNWLWEPEIEAEMGSQVQALVNGDTDPASVGKAIEAVAKDLRSSGRSYYS